MKNLTNKLNEKSLLILLKQGDYEAFSSIYHMYSMRILGRIIRLVKSEQIAEEILQELFLRIWENKECINPDLSFKSFLFTIAQNLVYDHFRKISLNDKFRSEFILTHSEGYEHIEEDVHAKQIQEYVIDAIGKLPPQCQRVFLLFKLEGKSYNEICDMLNISKSTVNNHLTKANSILKHHLPSRTVLMVSLLLFNF